MRSTQHDRGPKVTAILFIFILLFFFLSLELTICKYELPLDKIQYERGEKGDY